MRTFGGRQHERAMRIVIFLPNWVGDVVMATPTLRALRRHFPDAELIGVLRPYVAEVLAGTPWLDRQMLYHPRSGNRELGSLTLIRKLRCARPDTAVLLTNSLRTGLLAWASGARHRVGYVRYGRGPLLTEKLYHRKGGRRYVPWPVLDDYLRLAYALGCPEESSQVELATLPADEQAAEMAWRRLGLPEGREVVLLNSSGAFGAAKLWPTEYFAGLARRIVTEAGLSVLVLCGPSEREIARRVVAEARHPQVTSLADEKLSIGLSKACVGRSRLMVTTDSGPRHFAAALGIPVVTLFGPTHMAWSEYHFPQAVNLQREVPCGPCMKRTCPLEHHRCMRELTIDEVFRAVVQHLENTQESYAA